MALTSSPPAADGGSYLPASAAGWGQSAERDRHRVPRTVPRCRERIAAQRAHGVERDEPAAGNRVDHVDREVGEARDALDLPAGDLCFVASHGGGAEVSQLGEEALGQGVVAEGGPLDD